MTQTEVQFLRALEAQLKTAGAPVVTAGEPMPDELHIRWFKVTDTALLDHDDQDFLARIQVDVWGKDRASASNLAQQVFDLLVTNGNWLPAPSPGELRENEWFRVIRDYEQIWG